MSKIAESLVELGMIIFILPRGTVLEFGEFVQRFHAVGSAGSQVLHGMIQLGQDLACVVMILEELAHGELQLPDERETEDA